jgi:hypothetical protein
MRRSTNPSTPFRRTKKLPLAALAFGLTVASTLGWVAGCSSSNQAGGDPCASKYKGQCGGACTSDGNCKAGLYCSTDGKCTADCATSGASCGPNGEICTSRGRCEAGGSLFGNGGAGSTNFTDGGACVTDQRRGEGLPADIYIMNDQSQSMTCAIPTGGDRWTAMTKAITGFVTSTNAAGLGVGIQYFGQQGNGSDPNPGSSCNVADYTPADVEIAPLPGNAQAIITSLGRHKPTTYTPTPAAIDGAIAHAKAWATAHPDHIVTVVLATDGEPNKCGNAADRIGSVAASAAAAFAGSPQIRTYVIGIIGGSAANGGQGCNLDPAPPNKPDLNRVAQAGGTNTAFIVDAATGDTSAQFLDALNQIRGAAVVPCQYILPASVPGKTIDPNKVNVRFTPGGGTKTDLLQAPGVASCDATTGGWYYDNPAAPSKILLCPATCDKVKADAKAAVDVLIGCTTNVITR